MGLSVSFGYGDEATVVPFADLAIKKDAKRIAHRKT